MDLRLLLAAPIFTMILTLPTAWAEISPPAKGVGTIASLSGQAMVRAGLQTAAGIAPSRRALVNEALANGDVISTGPDSSLKILFNDNSIVDIGPSSMFKVDQFTGTDSGNRVALFTLLYGRLRALVTKATSDSSKLQVRTPDAVMGVRGTEFVVSAPANAQRGAVGAATQTSVRTEMTVLSGSVGVSLPRSNAPEVIVPGGSQIVAQPGMTGPPAPRALSPAQLAQVSQTSKVSDNTFDRTISVDAGAKNENAPAAATSAHAAMTNVEVAAAGVAGIEAPMPTEGVGLFGAMDSISTAPVTQLPGNLQTITVTLSR